MTWDHYRQQPPQHSPQQPQSQPPHQAWPPRQQQPYQGQWPPPQQQPPQYPPPGHRQPPRKRGNAGKIIAASIGGFFLLIVIIAVAASHGSPQAAPSAGATGAVPAASSATAPAAAPVLTYRVTGSPADVTYGPAGSDLSGHSPMTKTTKVGNAAYYAITAQLQGGGKVTCEILIGGKVISKAVADGSYQIADCEITQDPLTGQWTDANSS